MIFRILRLIAPIATIASPLLAQQGDRPNEVQAPVPSHWVIPPAPVLSADDELRTLTVAPGFRVELAAAEPLIGDPVAAVFGPDGRLWVVEMRSYMQNIEGAGENDPIGTVSVLEDTNADGRYDKRTVFMDKLVMPRALSLVADGVLIAEPPHLWFARDTNGDGVADSKVEIASNYGGVGNPEHMANGLVWMLDNWIYSANHTARYRYEGDGKFTTETTITRGQWGITQDDAGRIYYNTNSDPLRFDALPSHYLSRNPYLVSPGGTNVQLAPANLLTWPGRITPGVNRGYQNLRPDGTLTSTTAACSPVIYRGELFPEEFRGDAFVCEPSGNLVKRIRLVDRDGIPVGTNAYDKTEFLTSTDERFRPVSAYNGPDGALWIVDMYRGVIQHRTYVTSYLRKQVEDRGLEKGRGLGRIWRVVPESTSPHQPLPNLTKASSAELVRQLGSPSGWVRDTAQRLLVEKRDPSTVKTLKSVAQSDARSKARLHALWTLDGMRALDRDTVLAALRDDDAIVCTAAIRLSEKWLADPADGEIFERVTQAASGRAPAPGIALQQALSLGQSASPEKIAAMARIAQRHGGQRFVADALASGLVGQEERLIKTLIAGKDSEGSAPVIAACVSAMIQSADASRMISALSLLGDSATPSWARAAILDGVDRFIPRRADRARVAGKVPAEPTPLIALAKQSDQSDGKRAAELLQFLHWPGMPGDAEEAVKLTAAETRLFEQGRAQYAALCANCHQPEGQGLAGLAPALVNSRWVLGTPEIPASIVLCGKSDEGRIMPGLKSVLDDHAIASVLTFIRNSWGHSAKPIDPQLVAKVRSETAERTEPFTEAELVEKSGAK